MWKYTGNERPNFAEATKGDQESVWDYPRPPRLQADKRTVSVYANEVLIAKSTNCLRILETAGAPTFYIPPEDVNQNLLVHIDHRSHCEWKGIATYCANKANPTSPCGWQYTDPSQTFATIKNHYSFYPAILECYVDDERVRPQPGGFYGGWVTSEIIGPIKGEPGSEGW